MCARIAHLLADSARLCCAGGLAWQTASALVIQQTRGCSRASVPGAASVNLTEAAALSGLQRGFVMQQQHDAAVTARWIYLRGSPSRAVLLFSTSH
jgi:hypothetical protein